jgi:hypothetical protein
MNGFECGLISSGPSADKEIGAYDFGFVCLPGLLSGQWKSDLAFDRETSGEPDTNAAAIKNYHPVKELFAVLLE